MCAARKRTSSNESSSSKSNLGIPSTRRDPLCPGNEFERENCVHFFLRDHLGRFVPSSLLKLMGEALRISAELQEMRTHGYVARCAGGVSPSSVWIAHALGLDKKKKKRKKKEGEAQV